ncbi:hypothetical protein F7M76_24455 [Salmonella enterica subsp. enterica serovar Infantis]|nr:hypothetical protein F7M76_24570 [Salmonella enterica subsp. enterica serovar Infantis]UDG83453.1 hypothetical protein F7M76_24455 [Salmonella enterica subsp. enterica serovar Infantis]UEB69273.1 hypothetical protein LJY15_08260 [Salmonella enterica]UEB74030.1 hypothetical protein LJY16_09285 [Salmonella enterica]
MPLVPVVDFAQVAETCRRLRPAETSARRLSIVALASASSFVYLASRAATSRWRFIMSVIVAFASASL